MGTLHGPYEPDFAIGTPVRIRDVDYLVHFQRTWKHHNPLTDDQVAYAGQNTTVEQVGFYHGGDELYVLTGVPGLWHELCLMRIADRPKNLRARFS